MNPVFGISVSGMNAAGLRLANSANNIANVESTSRYENGETVRTPYMPTDVVQTSIEPTGGVKASVRPRDPASIPVYAPDHPYADTDGMVDYPNVSLEEELVDTKIASYDYKANLKVLKTADDMMQSLLDIKT
ncbi:MAG: flagellar basal body rod C-terminal domain-containing protein [Rickettsiales bacterium]